MAAEVGISASELARIERALAPWVSVVALARIGAVVGLDLSARTYPGAIPLRDARHVQLLAKLRDQLHPSLRWQVEVPLPNPGDQRAWDAMIRGEDWRYAAEAELNPIDGQALSLTLKQRDGNVEGIILLVPDTRQARQFRHEFAGLLASDFPIGSALALQRLRAGVNPGGSSIVCL